MVRDISKEHLVNPLKGIKHERLLVELCLVSDGELGTIQLAQ